MRRSAVLEGFVERREFGFDDFFSVAGNLKRLDHQLGAVVPHGAGGELGAVADNVVLVSEDFERILAE